MAVLEWQIAREPGSYAEQGRDVHGYVTRAARAGLFLSAGDCRLVGYRVPKEWGTLTEAQWGEVRGVAAWVSCGVWGVSVL